MERLKKNYIFFGDYYYFRQKNVLCKYMNIKKSGCLSICFGPFSSKVPKPENFNLFKI